MEDNNLVPRLAGTIFGGLLGPLGVPTSVAVEAATPLVLQAASSKQPKVGTVLSYKEGRPFKIFAGPWGEQSFESYQALRAKAPNEFPRISGVLPESLTAPKPKPSPASKPPTLAGSGGESADTGTSRPVEVPRQEPGKAGDVSAGQAGEQLGQATTDPLLERLYGLSERAFTPEFQDQAVERNIRQYIATTAITEALGAEKSEQRRRREVELAKIDQWTKAFQAQTSANALQNIAVSQAVIAMQQPNANTVAALQQGSNAAAQVLGVPTLRVT